MRGRPPTPVALKLIAGNPGKRRLDTNAPEPPSIGETAAPGMLGAEGQALWAQLAPLLGKYVGLAALDLLGLELLCASYERYRKALARLYEENRATGERVEATTYTTVGRNGKQIKTRPEYHQALEEVRIMRSLMAEYGLTPAARVRLKGLAQLDLPFGDGLDSLNTAFGGARPQAATAAGES